MKRFVLGLLSSGLILSTPAVGYGQVDTTQSVAEPQLEDQVLKVNSLTSDDLFELSLEDLMNLEVFQLQKKLKNFKMSHLRYM